MKSFQGMLVSSLLLVSCSGCVQVAALIELDPTGSGKLLIRYLISEQLSDPGNFISLKVNETPVETESSKKKSILSQVEEQAESLAAKLGEGVSYVGRKEIEKEKGWVGIQAEYRFADINQLKLPIVLQHDRKDGEKAKASEDKAKEISLLSMSDAGHFCFRFEPASDASKPNQLTIWRGKAAGSETSFGRSFCRRWPGVEIGTHGTIESGI